MSRPPALRLASIAALAGALACSAVSLKEGHQVPFTSTQMRIESVVQHSRWYEATLLSPKLNRVFWFPVNEECSAFLAPGRDVEYRRSGGYGYLAYGEVTCQVSGIGSLREWRDSYPRPSRSMSPAKPRTRADFKEIYRDDGVILVRGKFLIASYIHWPGPDDTVVAFKNDETCASALERGMAMTEYNPNGPYPLVVVQTGSTCPFEALIRPQ